MSRTPGGWGHPAGDLPAIPPGDLFGAGYLLGTRAGRERYEQLLELAHVAGGRFAGSGARRRLEEYGAQLEAYAAQSRVTQARVAPSLGAQSGGGQSRGGRSRRAAGAGSSGRTRS